MYDPAMNDPAERARFLNLAGLFEGGLVFVALGLAWIFGIDLVRDLELQAVPLIVGVLAALPPFGLLLITEWLKIPALERIKKLVLQTLGPPLAALRWNELILVAALAGLGEEMLFRGVVQPLFERWVAVGGWGRTAGLLLSNVIFGLLHLITPTYALLAGAMGVYFGILLDVTGPRNLWTPIVAHGLYDYLAFLVVIRSLRPKPAARGQNADEESPQTADPAPPPPPIA